MAFITETRKFSRLLFTTESNLVDPTTKTRHPARLLDLSLKGALVERPKFWNPEPGHHCHLEINLAQSNVVLTMESEVAHVNPSQLGLRFLAIDLDSITHLRRLMELNLGDPSLLERELFSLGE
ncbi:MAG: PilZ domain-containing protein [Deltaproteobacteria bacterium]|nr:PilZ domain-containing protein [Deltaproteobacteria bacterium]